MKLCDMRPEKRCPYYAIILLILIVLTFNAKSIDPQPPTSQPKAPKWARPGVYLSYAWALYEYVNKSEVDQMVRRMLLSPFTVGGSETLNFTLTGVDEDRGFFNITTGFPGLQALATYYATYYWENSTLVVTDPATGRASSSYFPLYLYAIPENASVVRVSTVMGENEAYLVKHEDQSVIEYFYYHKYTRILLAMIELGESEYGVDVLGLVFFDTNVALYSASKLIIEVKDEEGMPIDNATVTLSSKDFGNFTKATNASGIAEFEIPRANYTLSISKEGYLPYEEILDFSETAISAKTIQLKPELTFWEKYRWHTIAGAIAICILIPIIIKSRKRGKT